jgi:excisionase family DNA binding protein
MNGHKMARHLRKVESHSLEASVADDDYCGTSYAAKLLGLSVATVQTLVEKGEIEAWKTQGGHRRISLRSVNKYLQRYNPQVAQLAPVIQQRLQILVVEDDENQRELYLANFDDWDMPVDCTVVQSALEALMDIGTLQPDLLITDLKMPGVDGIEMLKVLKGRSQLQTMQVLVVTGMAPEEIKSRGGLPDDALLRPKPLNFDWLHGYVSAQLMARPKAA